MAWRQREQTKGKTATYTNRSAQDDMIQQSEKHISSEIQILLLFSWKQRGKESPIHSKNKTNVEDINNFMLTCFSFVSCDYEVGHYVENSK